MEVTLDKLQGLTPIDQGRKLFEANMRGATPARHACCDLENLWSIYAPQHKLFREIRDTKSENYDTIVRKALYDSAQSLNESCLDSIGFASHREEKDLQLNLLRDLMGQKKAIKKTEVNQVDMYKIALTPASECYGRIAAFVLPQLKMQKIGFKSKPVLDNISVLTDSVIAHNLIYSLYSAFKDSSIYRLCEGSEGMPSYISEVLDVGIEDIKKRLADGEGDSAVQLAPLLDTSNGNIQLITLDKVLGLYEDIKSD